MLRQTTEGRTIAVVGDVYRFLATGQDTNGKYALWEAIVPPGGGPPSGRCPSHSHARYDVWVSWASPPKGVHAPADDRAEAALNTAKSLLEKGKSDSARPWLKKGFTTGLPFIAW